MEMNRFPAWKNALIFLTLLLGVIYALPNIYGDDPALQIIGRRGFKVNPDILHSVNNAIKTKKIPVQSIEMSERDILIKFHQGLDQRKAKKILSELIGEHYVVADHLAPARPDWLGSLGANPMKLGLDLKGGVHLLIQVDMSSALKNRDERSASLMRAKLREARVRYSMVAADKKGGVMVAFRENKDFDKGLAVLNKQFKDYVWQQRAGADKLHIDGRLTEVAIREIKRYTMEQTLTILRTRVNALGVSEPLVQQEGADRIVVELPGVQNSAQAQDIIGRTATVQFYLVDEKAMEGLVDPNMPPLGTVVYQDREGRSFALKRQPVLTGDSIVGAYADFGEQGAEVVLRLGGNISRFTKITAANIGKRMASLYTETRFDSEIVNGKEKRIKRQIQEVINAATIQAALGAQFRITGLSDMDEARNLALLLRSGALSAPIYVVESRTIGPTLGQENISMGMRAMMAGLLMVLVFMAIYYRGFGVIANIALLTNLILLTAILSLFHAVLTLPGIAGIVLTLGMAVDANVLIFERIREEIRNGASMQASIHAGFEKAFITIVDANVTTFIAAVVLFTIGTGPIKGFAVVLSIGLLTSMFTGVTVSRAIVNMCFGGRTLKRLSIGI